MTVKEFIQAFKDLPENATISLIDYSTNYGDSNTQIDISSYATVCAYTFENMVIIEIND